MGIDYSITTALGWELEAADIEKITGPFEKLDHDEPWEEASEKLDCRIDRVGNSYSGEFTYLLNLMSRGTGRTVGALTEVAKRADAVRAKAAEFGVLLVGEPELLTRQNVY